MYQPKNHHRVDVVRWLERLFNRKVHELMKKENNDEKVKEMEKTLIKIKAVTYGLYKKEKNEYDEMMRNVNDRYRDEMRFHLIGPDETNFLRFVVKLVDKNTEVEWRSKRNESKSVAKIGGERVPAAMKTHLTVVANKVKREREERQREAIDKILGAWRRRNNRAAG